MQKLKSLIQQLIATVKPSPFGDEMTEAGISLWHQAGLAAAADSGQHVLDDLDHNALIYEAPRCGVTVIVARGERAEQLRAAWKQIFNEEVS